MPIPSHVLGELAARYGQVDPADRQAVEDFYVALVTSGDEAMKQAIVREMMERQDERDSRADGTTGH